MNKKQFGGIFPALMTSFTEDGLNDKRIKQHVAQMKDIGVHGFYVGGSTGEMLLCTLDERKQLLEDVLEENNKKCKVIAHIGCPGTREAIELAKHADKAGADAISSVTPFYFKYSFKEIKTYYQRLCDSVEVPVIIYNIPLLTGVSLGYDQLCEIMSIDGVGGMKFTCTDFFILERIRADFPEAVIYNGFDEDLLSGLAAGADGGIGSTYNFMPEFYLRIFELFNSGDCKKALAVQSIANRYIQKLLKFGVNEGCKKLISLRFGDYGKCREPFLPLCPESEKEITETLFTPMMDEISKL
ncbi:MAG: N-acetylneuraminate lyase [Firmicutes bacterium]|nr:N-acetylneuraminate lyase [Bacillota bacterium]